MNSFEPSHDIDYLRNQLADRLDAYSIRDWSPAVLAAVVAILDLRFVEGGTNKTPVLKPVRGIALLGDVQQN